MLLAAVKDQCGRGFSVTVISGPPDGSGSWISGDLEETEARLLYVPDLKREIDLVPDLKAFFALVRIFREGRYDLVHLYTSKAGLLGSVAARVAKVPGVVYAPQGHIFRRRSRVPGVPERGPKRALLYLLRRIACACSDRIVALNHLDASEQIRLRLAPRRKFRVIRNGIDPESLLPHPFPPPSEIRKSYGAVERPVLLFVGRLVPEKGLELLMEAVAALKSEFTPLLLVVGEGPYESRFREKAVELDLEDDVFFAGACGDVGPFYLASDLFVLPSYYEAFGLVVLEAMSCGVPVVASRVGGVPGILENGRHGLLFEPGDAEDLAQKIAAVLRDPQGARAKAGEARRHVISNYSVGRMTGEVMELYREVLGNADRAFHS